jgi:dolichol kinase
MTRARDSREISFIQEVWRKATHMGALIIPGSYQLFGLSKYQMLAVMVPAFVLMVLVDIARLRNWAFWRSVARPLLAPMIRSHEEAGDFTGAFYILGSTCLTIALFSKPVAIAALTFIIVGDTFAALIGRKFGRHKFGRKSIEGSLGCLAGTVIVAVLTPHLPLSVGLIGAVTATVAEAVSFTIDDNVSVPLASGLIMTLFLKFSGAF